MKEKRTKLSIGDRVRHSCLNETVTIGKGLGSREEKGREFSFIMKIKGQLLLLFCGGWERTGRKILVFAARQILSYINLM